MEANGRVCRRVVMGWLVPWRGICRCLSVGNPLSQDFSQGFAGKTKAGYPNRSVDDSLSVHSADIRMPSAESEPVLFAGEISVCGTIGGDCV